MYPWLTTQPLLEPLSPSQLPSSLFGSLEHQPTMRAYAAAAPYIAHDVTRRNSIRSLVISWRLAYSTMHSANLCILSKTSKRTGFIHRPQSTAGQLDTDVFGSQASASPSPLYRQLSLVYIFVSVCRFATKVCIVRAVDNTVSSTNLVSAISSGPGGNPRPNPHQSRSHAR